MIVDKARVFFRSGSGGEGSSSLKSLSARKVTGSGGNGGTGADVIIKANPHLYDLSKFKGNKKFIAQDGSNGGQQNKKGKDGRDLIVGLPLGTRVLEPASDKLICDITCENDEFLICRGGGGGKGNYKRDYTIPAQPGEEKEVILDYRILNEVALVGFANSGKTSLFNLLTGHNYKVAHYPFTTTSCIWAKSEYDFHQFRVLDTPAVKKSKDNKETPENRFLRHILRSKIIILISDDQDNHKNQYADLKKEIESFDKSLLKGKKIFYLLNKIDKIDKTIKERSLIAVSAKEKTGIEHLKKKIVAIITK